MDEAVGAVLARYGLSPVAEPEAVTVGSGNWNRRVETGDGPRFLRQHHRYANRERLEQEHALAAWAVERGIPSPLPEPALSAETIVEHDGSLWSLFPWAPGAPATRGEMTERQIWAAGEMHGRIHRVLLSYPESVEVAPPRPLNVERSAAHLERIIEAAASQGAEDSIMEGLALQRQLLCDFGTNADETGLARSPSHGDYHDQQLLFTGDQLTAVTDWEMFGMRPRVWEVVRSMYVSQIMEGPHVESYVAGYQEQMELPGDECRLAMDLWWQGRIHYEWVFHAYFLQGNTRAAEFFPETLRSLRALADAAARRELTERFVRAATG